MVRISAKNGAGKLVPREKIMVERKDGRKRVMTTGKEVTRMMRVGWKIRTRMAVSRLTVIFRLTILITR